MLIDLINNFISFNITPRAAISSIISFLFVLGFCPLLIRYLKKQKIDDSIEKKDSQMLIDLSRSKKGIPTMGGLIVIISVLFSALLFSYISDPQVMIVILGFAGFGLLGFWDDWKKHTSKNSHGLSKGVKMFFQLIISFSIGMALWVYLSGNPESLILYIPLIHAKIHLGIYFPLWVTLVVTASSNAVNLTDGMDGLAIGCIIMVAIGYSIITYIVGRVDFSSYLGVPYVYNAGELTVITMALLGAAIGFLWFNCHPAEIFMGDVGSLSMGGLIGMIAICTKQEIVLIIIGAIFVIETLSVFLQVLSFKLFKKRIFRCAPIHHHYQFKKYDESKIVIRFWIVAAVLTMATLALIKL